MSPTNNGRARKPEGSCHYCGQLARTWDHIVPRASNGCDRDWNRIESCERCNTVKANAWPTCTCARCLWAVWRWEAGDRTPSRGVQRKRRRKAVAEAAVVALEAERAPSVVPLYRDPPWSDRNERLAAERRQQRNRDQMIPNWLN